MTAAIGRPLPRLRRVLSLRSGRVHMVPLALRTHGHTGIVQPDPGGKIGARLGLPAMQRRSAVLRSRLYGRSGLGVDAEAASARSRMVGAQGAPPSSNIKDLNAQTSLKANIAGKGYLPAVTNTSRLIPIFATPKSRHRFRMIFEPARRLLVPLARPPARAIDWMPVIAPRVLRAILIGPSNEKTGPGRELPTGGRP